MFFINVVLNDSLVNDTIRTINNLNSTTNYYWKVRAKNSTGWGNFSSFNIFTTGVPWVQMPNGIGSSTKINSFTVTNGINLFAGTQGSGIFLSTNNGVNWSAVNNGLPSLNVTALTTNGNNIFAGVNGYGIYLSTNNGGNWSAVNSGLTNYQLTSFTVKGTIIFAGTYGGGVFQTTNNGLNWIPVNNGISNGNVNALHVNNGNIYAGTNGGIFRSTDDGGTWTGTLTGTTFLSLASNSSNIYAGANNVGIWRSTNNGASWFQVITGMTNQYVNCLAVNESKIFAGISGSNGGMFLSTNNGNNWLNINLGLSNPLSVFALIISNNYVFAGTLNTSVWRRSYTALFPVPPFLVSPVNNSTDIPVNPNLVWNKSQYATGYDVILAKDSLFSNIVVNDSLLTDTIKIITGLDANTQYYWKVRAINNLGWGYFSTIWNFITILPVPVVPLLLSPASGSVDISITPNLDWGDVTYAAGYRVQASIDSLFGNTAFDSTGIIVSNINVPSGKLTTNTKYFWRVNASNAAGTSSWSTVWNFTTAPNVPNAPSLSQPANGAINQPLNITFKWFNSFETLEIKNSEFILLGGQNSELKENKPINIPHTPNTVSKYWFEYSTDSTFVSGVVRDTSLVDTTKSVTGLNILTKYFWRVKAKNQTGWGNFSSVWNFTTTYSLDSVSPGQNKINIPLTSDIKTYFHNSMSSSTMDSNSVTLFGSMTGRKRGSINYNSGNNSMQIVPNNPFKYGELISTTLDTGIKTSLGYSISPFIWSFTAKANPSNLVFNNTSSVGVGSKPNYITTGDFDGDGDLDLVVINSVSNSISILKNNGSGIFTVSSSVGVGNNPQGISTDDYDGDGDLDIAVSNLNSNSVSILKNNGTGAFTVSSSVGMDTPQGITSGDFDSDGDIDLVVVNKNPCTVSILKNDGTGTFTVLSSAGVGLYPVRVIAGDIDGDGDLDLAVTNNSAWTVSILKNNGSGIFTESSSVGVGNQPQAIIAGDIDGDGDLDIAVSNFNSNSISILKNNGTGTFAVSSSVGVGNQPYGISMGDIDGDGDLDIAVSNFNSNSVSILKNNGTGAFSVSSSVVVGSNPIGITAGDFNSDGVLDLTVANINSNNVSILINFTPPYLSSPANNSTGNLTTLNFYWNKSTGASNYRIQIATDSLFSNLVINDSTLLGTDSVKSVSGLSNLTWYYWRMNSISANGTSLMSEAWKFKTQGTPTQVMLLQPANNAINQPTNVTFKWTKAFDQTLSIQNSKPGIQNDKKESRKIFINDSPFSVSNYWFEYSTDSNFVTSVVRDSTLTDTTKSVTGLSNLTKYFWRVKAKNQTGWGVFSAVWCLTTIVPVPAVPVLLSPGNNTTGNSVNINLVWNKPMYATGYNVLLATDAGFTNIVLNDSTLTDSVKTLTNLNPLTIYYWKIRAKNISGWSSFSSAYNFKTVGTATVVVLSNPPDNSVNQPLSITFKWFKATDQTFYLNSIISDKTQETDETSAVSNYWFEYGTDSTFISILGKDSTLTDTTKSIAGLSNSTKYYWRVKAKNQIGWGTFCTAWNFTTIVAIPASPVLSSPANNSISVSLTPALTWGSVSGASSYRIQVSTDSLFATSQWDTTGVTAITTTVPAGKLTGLTKYYWRVNATNTGGTGNWSSVWNFRTLQNLILNLKVYFEGFWDGTSHVSDTTMIYLANATNFTFVDSAKIILSTTGTAAVNFTKASNGNYYLVVNHRNHLETWSKLAQSFITNAAVNYDFTTAVTQAYGDNMKQVGSVWVLFGGDANRDGSVDALDVIFVVNQFGTQGYLEADFNGDQDVSGADIVVFVPNFGATKIVPTLVVKPVIKTKDYDMSRIDNRKTQKDTKKQDNNTQDKTVKKQQDAVKKNNN